MCSHLVVPGLHVERQGFGVDCSTGGRLWVAWLLDLGRLGGLSKLSSSVLARSCQGGTAEVASALTRAGLVARLSMPLPGMVRSFQGVPPLAAKATWSAPRQFQGPLRRLPPCPGAL